MFRHFSLTLKLAMLPAVALLGMLLFVSFTGHKLAANDERLVSLETQRYPTLEKADAVLFQFSRVPALLNSAVAAGEQQTLDEARQVLATIATKQQELAQLTRQQPERGQQLDAWQAAVKAYAENALNASSQLVAGKASFADLRPSLDRMATDLSNAQQAGDRFRADAYQDFRQTLAQTRTDNAAMTQVGIILTVLLIVLVSLGSWLVIRGIMANVHGVIDSVWPCWAWALSLDCWVSW